MNEIIGAFMLFWGTVCAGVILWDLFNPEK